MSHSSKYTDLSVPVHSWFESSCTWLIWEFLYMLIWEFLCMTDFWEILYMTDLWEFLYMADLRVPLHDWFLEFLYMINLSSSTWLIWEFLYMADVSSSTWLIF